MDIGESLADHKNQCKRRERTCKKIEGNEEYSVRSEIKGTKFCIFLERQVKKKT